MTEYEARRTACGGCSRRVSPLPATSPAHVCRYLCPRCGSTGFRRRSDGFYVWSLGGDGSHESRQARASWKHDGADEMKRAGAGALPGLEG